jgi:hypothetical protein
MISIGRFFIKGYGQARNHIHKNHKNEKFLKILTLRLHTSYFLIQQKPIDSYHHELIG